MHMKQNEVGASTPQGDWVPNHECYRHVRRTVTELLAEARPVADPVVPACPEWTLKGLLTHLVGVAAATIGKLSGQLAAGSSSSADMDIPELLAKWEELGAEADLLLADVGGRTGNILVMDAFTHELDIRYAIGAELPAEHPAFAGAFTVLANGFGAAVTDNGLPALRLSTGSTQWTVGAGGPVATLTATRYDLYRSLAGRRSHHQITALDWNRDSHRWLPAFTWGPFTPPATPVEPVGLVRRAWPS
jgi:uncharacterized protein (TIGR03083 family)